jgi:hypothetical protein
MGVVKCAACGFKVNDSVSICPDCGADPHTGQRERDSRGVMFAGGSYVAGEGTVVKGAICFTPDWIGIGKLDGTREPGATVAMSDTAAVDVDGGQVNPGAGELAMTWVFTGMAGVAIGAATKIDCTSILVHTRDGRAARFGVMDQRCESLRAAVAPVLEAAGVALREGIRSQGVSVDTIGGSHAAVPRRVAAVPSVADELAKLGALRDSGVITEDEFATLKARLVG